MRVCVRVNERERERQREVEALIYGSAASSNLTFNSLGSVLLSLFLPCMYVVSSSLSVLPYPTIYNPPMYAGQ
jgi:hypothetical protein